MPINVINASDTPRPICPKCQKILVNLEGLHVRFENESDVYSSKLRGISLLIECACGFEWNILGRIGSKEEIEEQFKQEESREKSRRKPG